MPTKALLLAATAAGALAPLTPALAQSAGTDTADIIVTARRTEERLQDVPISISVFNQQQLLDRNVVDATDLARFTPSLSVSTAYSSQNVKFSIRGFTQDDHTAPSVGIYFADVVAPRGTGNLPAGEGAGPGVFFDLQNVQVLKGPQGTLFGRNTTGGAVLIVPQKPTDKVEGYLEGTVGSYDLLGLQGVINLPINDSVRLRVGLDHRSREGYVKNTSGIGPNRFNDLNYTAARASLVVDVTPEIENYTIFSYSHTDTTGDLSKLFVCNPENSAANFIGFNFACPQVNASKTRGDGFWTAQNDIVNPVARQNTWQGINTTTWKAADNLTIKNIVSYAQLKYTQRSDLFGNDFKIPGTTLPLQFTTILPFPGAPSTHQSTLTEELQFQGSALDDRLSWQAGGYYEYSKPLDAVGGHVPAFLNCSPPVSAATCSDPLGFGTLQDTPQKLYNRDFGIYAQGTYKLNDQFKLTGGIRYTNDKSHAVAQRVLYVFTAPQTTIGFCSDSRLHTGVPITSPSDCTARYQTKSSAPTWLIDVDYNPTPDLLIYAKYTRGYRQGAVDGLAAEGYEIFKPEKVDTYEGGVKATIRGEAVRGTFNVAGFYNNFTNQQLQVTFSGPNVTPQTGITNAGKSRIWGAEAEASLKFFDAFDVDASYAYLNTKVIEITPLQLPAGSIFNVIRPASRAGDVLALTPKHKLSVTGTYTLPVPERIGDVSVGATFTYTSSQRVNNNGPYSFIQPTRLVNLSLNWKSVGGGPVDLGAFVTNATNKKYFSHVSGFYADAGFDTGQLLPPRMYGMRLRVRLD